MISSPEEALLLLNKWMTESAKVLALISPPDRAFVSRLEGRISGIEQASSTAVLQSEDNFILFKLHCKVGYGEDVSISSTYDEMMSNEVKHWKSALVLTYACGASIVLCATE